ncbi:hypothetical protein NRIC_16290 [Enterococcus florum]|uniref:site-specific DNA-methyltransferase (adenine-specific) n=1 Tax=Enterococcus florum TaxID=2480627 RepID=A0A4P5PCN8_9ENTE|nr:N-6 DNA methylase [Enterococcus florum]GCF93738.1 hypothetical protein NRIC_16290 [Enterococcus florum]
MMNAKNKEKYNQYFTNIEIAKFMASLVNLDKEKREINILDPGAGEGILGIEAVEYIVSNSNISTISLTAYEIDKVLSTILKSDYERLKQDLALRGIAFKYKVSNRDFLNVVSERMKSHFDLVIMNPPYEKIAKNSKEYKAMEKQGYSKTNLYSSFIEKSLDFLKEEGQLIAIIPRSFANGTYFSSFRENVFSNSNLTNIHLFETRKLFTDVLQENIIIKTEKKAAEKNSDVIISYSIDNDVLENSESVTLKNHEIIDVKKKFQLRIMKDNQDFEIMRNIHALPCKLQDLKLEVSTGPIVDFREGRDFKRSDFELFTVPYLFPEHFNLATKMLNWPRYPINKANYIINDDAIRSKLRKNGNYILVKRFSSKEETRRINAALWLSNFTEEELVGFDNKVNYYHFNKEGLDLDIAKGVCLYLNSTIVDRYFRQVSGNTQVNVSDLRNLNYPDRESLIAIGNQWNLGGDISQDAIDDLINNRIF